MELPIPKSSICDSCAFNVNNPDPKRQYISSVYWSFFMCVNLTRMMLVEYSKGSMYLSYTNLINNNRIEPTK